MDWPMDFLKRCWKVAKKLKETTFGGTLFEILTIWILSNVPVAILVFVKMITAKSGTFPLMAAIGQLDKEFVPAEVFVYICVILAPILWMMGAHWRAKTHYPLFLVLGSAQVVILGLTGIVYALHKTGIGLNQPVVETFASWAYGLVIVIWFSTIYFRRAVLGQLEPIYALDTAQSITEKLKEQDRD